MRGVDWKGRWDVSWCGGCVCDVGWLQWGNVGLDELSGNLLSYRFGGAVRQWLGQSSRSGNKLQGIMAAPSTARFSVLRYITGEKTCSIAVRQQKTGSISVIPTANPIDSKQFMIHFPGGRFAHANQPLPPTNLTPSSQAVALLMVISRLTPTCIRVSTMSTPQNHQSRLTIHCPHSSPLST